MKLNLNWKPSGSKKKTAGTKRTVVLELAREQVGLAIVDRSDDRPPALRWKQIPWPAEAAESGSAIDAAALGLMLKTFVAEEKLAGASLRVILNGDFCVTRVAAGTNDEVARELRQLEQRSARYLSLGHGSKTFAQSIRAIDAKRSQGAMSIVNDDVLNAVQQAAREANLKPDSIEHSLVTLSRAVGRAGRDAEAPIIVIEFNSRGVDLGVSHQGRLLLDYRPGGASDGGALAETVMKHLGRIQRYCFRHFQFASGKIRNVVLCGKTAEVESLRDFFAQSGGLNAEILDPHAVCPDWQFENIRSDDSWLLPSIGALLAEEMPESGDSAPDLMAPLRLSAREPLVPGLIRNAWPIAAALVLTAGVYGVGLMEYGRASTVQAKAKQAKENVELLGTHQLELTSVEAKAKYLKKIASNVARPRWREFLEDVCSCLPEGVWLEALKVDKNGEVMLSGPSFSENSVYEFVDDLKKIPTLANVGLEGTRNARLQGGPATLFDVKCEYTGSTELEKGT